MLGVVAFTCDLGSPERLRQENGEPSGSENKILLFDDFEKDFSKK